MVDKHPLYDFLKKTGPDRVNPARTALLRYWEHCEQVHGAKPEDFGQDVVGWHRRNHLACKTFPTFKEAAWIPPEEFLDG